MTTDQAAARGEMIGILRRIYNLTETTTAHLVDIGLDAERNGQPAWPAIARAVSEGAARGEAWAIEAQSVGRT